MKILSLLGPWVNCVECGWCGRDLIGGFVLTGLIGHIRQRHSSAVYVEYVVRV